MVLIHVYQEGIINRGVKSVQLSVVTLLPAESPGFTIDRASCVMTCPYGNIDWCISVHAAVHVEDSEVTCSSHLRFILCT